MEANRFYLYAIKAKKLLVMLILFISSHSTQAQDQYGDSLKGVLTKNIHDTVRVNTLIALCKYNLGADNDLALQYANDAKKEAHKANFGSGFGYCYKYSGLAYYYKGQLREAMDEWQQSLHIFDSIQNKLGMSNILNNIGAVYFGQGENTRALENYLQSLKLSQQIGDQLRIATAMINIGAVYMDKRATYKLALEYYLPALEISEKLKDLRAIGAVCLNIGVIYLNSGNDKLAEQYLQKALVNTKGEDLEPSVLKALGDIEKARKNYDKALAYQQEAYKKAVENDNSLYAAQALIAKATLEFIMGKKDMAVEDYKKVIPLATEMGDNLELQNSYEGLAEVYSSVLRFDSAYKYLQLLGNVKDTLFNEAADKRLSVLRLDFELEKKESQITQLTTVNDLNEKVIQRQKIIRNLIIAGLIFILIFLYTALRQKRRIEKEKKRSEELLLNILPEEVAEELKAKGEADAKLIEEVTVLFTDFKGFTAMSEKLTPKELVKDIHECFSAFDHIMEKYGMEKIKTIGDSYMAAGGLPTPNKTHATDAVNAAIEIRQFINEGKTRKLAVGEPYFEIRIGIHTGPVVAGIVGVKKFAYDIWGDTVNTASRMESSGEVGQVNISESTYTQVKDKFACSYRGEIEAKGKGKVKMYFVE